MRAGTLESTRCARVLVVVADVNGRIADNADDMIAAARDGDREQFMSLGAAEEELHDEFPDDPMFEGC